MTWVPKLGDYLETARHVHQDTVVVAMHTDLIGDISERHSRGEQRVLGRRHADTFRKGGVHCVCDHVIGETFETQCFPTKDLLEAYGGTRHGGGPYNPSTLKHNLKILEYMLNDLAESGDDFVLTTSVTQIRSVVASGKIAFVACAQGATPLEDQPEILSLFHRLGLKVLQLVTNRGNPYAGSARMSPKLGLSELGRTIVAEAQRLRIVVDVSAVSKPGFWELMEMIDGPVMASQSNASALCNFADNFDDDQIRAVAEKGGVVGLIANAKMVTPKSKPMLTDFVDHIDYIAKLVGISHVGIGPDIVEESWYPKEAYERLFQEASWSGRYPEGFSQVAELPNVTAEMLRRGYSVEDVKKVLGENVLRVFSDVWGR